MYPPRGWWGGGALYDLFFAPTPVTPGVNRDNYKRKLGFVAISSSSLVTINRGQRAFPPHKLTLPRNRSRQGNIQKAFRLSSRTMGLVQEIAGHPLARHFLALGLGAQVAIAVGGFIVLSVVLNVASQILSRNPNEPPMVFHWFPFLGNTISYGMDPPRFFKANRAKVCVCTFLMRWALLRWLGKTDDWFW